MDDPNVLAIPIPLMEALNHYQKALDNFENSQMSGTAEQALEILLARDKLQNILEAQSQIPISFFPQLIPLDQRIQEQAAQIAQILDLAVYRQTLPSLAEAWWWNLDNQGQENLSQRWGWLWKGGRIGLWTVNLGLLGTLVARFFSGASGLVEMMAIALPSLLAVLQANNELTKSGQEGFNRLLNRLKIPQSFHEEAKFIPAAFLFFLLMSIWFLQPQMARQINRQGWKAQKQGQLTRSEQNYLKAIALDSVNLDATYNLGNLYEELQNFDNARKYYIIAAKGGVPEAYNNLARLYILQNKYSEAIILLREGLGLIDKEEQKESQPPDNLPEVKYSLLKNLGWAKFKQNQNEEAQGYLLAAIGIASDPKVQSYIPNPGAAHCLLAQVLEAQRQSSDALVQWQECYSLVEKRLSAGEIRNPEEETWFSLAKQKLTIPRESQP